MLGKILAGAGQLDASDSVHLTADRKEKPAEGPTAEYGNYLASLTCMYCHGENLRGGPPVEPSYPAPTDLAASGAWSFEDFATAMKTGKTPDGREMDPEHMPWSFTKHMTDDELTAIYKLLEGLQG